MAASLASFAAFDLSKIAACCAMLCSGGMVTGCEVMVAEVVVVAAVVVRVVVPSQSTACAARSATVSSHAKP